MNQNPKPRSAQGPASNYFIIHYFFTFNENALSTTSHISRTGTQCDLFETSPQSIYYPFPLISVEVFGSYLTSYSRITTSHSLPLAQSIIAGDKSKSHQHISISFIGFSFFLMRIWFYLITSDTDKRITCLLEDCDPAYFSILLSFEI